MRMDARGRRKKAFCAPLSPPFPVVTRDPFRSPYIFLLLALRHHSQRRRKRRRRRMLSWRRKKKKTEEEESDGRGGGETRRRKKKGGSLPLPRGGGSVGTVQGRQWTGGGERDAERERERREKGLARKCKDRSIDRATGGEEAAADTTTTTYVPTKSFPPLPPLFSLLAYACSMERSTIIFLGHEKGGKDWGEAGSFSHAGRGNISAQRSRYPPREKKFS